MVFLLPCRARIMRAGSDPVGSGVAIRAVDGAGADRERERCAAVLAGHFAPSDVELASAGLADDLLRPRHRCQFVAAATAFLGIRIGDFGLRVFAVKAEECEEPL